MDSKKIKRRIDQLEARLQSQQVRLKRREQARDIRRKILLGTFVLHQLEISEDRDLVVRLRAWLREGLPDFLQRNGGKGLFPELLEQPGSSTKSED